MLVKQCPLPLCIEWRMMMDCETCNNTRMVPVTGNGGDGFDPCPDCVDDDDDGRDTFGGMVYDTREEYEGR